MGFTVTHQGGTEHGVFDEYLGLLWRQGIDLARARRVPEPGSGRRWLPVWKSRGEAQKFADELRRRSLDPAWEVVEVNGQISEGPLGPVEIQTVRQSAGWAFDMDPLTRRMIQRLFPGSCRAGAVFVSTDNGQGPGTPAVGIAELAEPVTMLLTGLSIDQILKSFGGYRIYDVKAHKDLLARTPDQA